jgi:nucleoside-diphosphate-sugar epimerase
MSNDLVLVTGGTGFVGAHCIDQLLRAGYHVRTTVRDLKRAADVRAMLKIAESPRPEALSFAAADLTADAGWKEAVEGCRYVLHVASPLPSTAPKDEDEVIVPAREGTLRVLCAARDAGVERVVVTSSFAAIGYGHPQRSEPFTEKDWTDPSKSDMTAYVKSKAIAERAAWDFMDREGKGLELSVVSPVAVFGPVLGPDYSASILFVQRLLDGAIPACPKLTFGAVDVRDVASLHLLAMTHPDAKGERFLAVSGEAISLLGLGTILRQNLGPAARRVPTHEMPNWLVHLVALFITEMKQLLPELGKLKQVSNAKAKRVLGWSPRSNENAILATAESLQRLGLLKK